MLQVFWTEQASLRQVLERVNCKRKLMAVLNAENLLPEACVTYKEFLHPILKGKM